jgi:hypothetical protein
MLHLLAIDFYRTVNDELPSLSRAASEQCSKNSCVKSPFNRRVGHLHVGYDFFEVSRVYLISP